MAKKKKNKKFNPKDFEDILNDPKILSELMSTHILTVQEVEREYLKQQEQLKLEQLQKDLEFVKSIMNERPFGTRDYIPKPLYNDTQLKKLKRKKLYKLVKE